MRTRVELLLLAALARGPKPAYGVATEVRRRGGAFVDDALFDSLHGLERDGLVASGRSLRRRRVYRLTPLGQSRLERERSAWVGLARTVAAALDSAA